LSYFEHEENSLFDNPNQYLERDEADDCSTETDYNEEFEEASQEDSEGEDGDFEE